MLNDCSDINADNLLDMFEYKEGKLYWKKNRNTTLVGEEAGRAIGTAKYNSVSIKGKRVYAHRIIWAMHNGKLPSYQIDHIDGNKWNNNIENLRQVFPRTNNQNIKNSRSHSKLGVLGVSKVNGKYRALIMHQSKSYYLGLYKTITQAKNAYAFAKSIFHKEAFNMKGI